MVSISRYNVQHAVLKLVQYMWVCDQQDIDFHDFSMLECSSLTIVTSSMKYWNPKCRYAGTRSAHGILNMITDL